jgi:hypothetical protein
MENRNWARIQPSKNLPMVSKRRDRLYRAGRSPDWIKVKNRSHPALERVKESFSS